MEMGMLGDFVLDRAAILDRLGGDEDIYSMMVDMFLQDVENNCAALAAALADGTVEVLQREVHTVKGLLATFSDDPGAAAAFAVELQVKAGQVQALAGEVEKLQARLREVARVLQVAAR
jgi:HPt (histidine-containing phosphotransfer) domain-containing protein